MIPFWLRLQAPFAAFRPLQTGDYRISHRCLPPSTAYGLLLGLAGVDMRDPENRACTGIRAQLPKLRLALGALAEPEVAVLVQQLHGNSSDPDRLRGAGAKTRVAVLRRELLVDFQAVLAVQAEPELAEAVLAALAGQPGPGRYGLPFAGDNNLLFDRIDGFLAPVPARWYLPVTGAGPPPAHSESLSLWIDRADSARTRRQLMAPMPEPQLEPPEEAWLGFPGQARSSSR